MVLKREAKLTSKEGLQLILATAALYCVVDWFFIYILEMLYNMYFPVVSVITVIAGLVLGLPGAVGATLGDFMSQLLFVDEGVQIEVLDCMEVFLMAYFPFRMWFAYQPKKASHYVYNKRTFVKFIFIMALLAVMETGLAHALRSYDASRSFTIVDMWCVFNEMFLFPTLLGMPLLMLWQKLSPVRYVRYKDENQSGLPEKAIKLLVALNLLYIISLLAGFMSSIAASVFSIVGLMLFCFCCNVPSEYEPHELESTDFRSIAKKVIDDIICGSALIAIVLYISLFYNYHDDFPYQDKQEIVILFYLTIYLIVIMFSSGTYCVLLILEPKFIRRITELSKKARAYVFSETAISNVFEEGLDAEASEINEVDVLQRTMAKADVDLREYVAHMKESNDERSKAEGQLAIAQSIQSGLLPDINKLQKDVNGYKLMVGFELAEFVCGGMYDCFKLDKDHIMFLVADADNEGVPAALFMTTTLSLIKNNADLASPGKILKKVNHSLARRNKEKVKIGMWLGILEMSSGRLKYVNTLQNKLLIVNSKNYTNRILEEISGPAFGILPDIDEFKEFETIMAPGEKLLVYTDGAVCANAAKPAFGLERLLNSFKAANTIDQVIKDIKTYGSTEDLEDDIILLWLERLEKEGPEAC